MTRAKRQMQEDLKAVDLILELVDARIPEASRNPDLKNLGQGKGRILIMCKADLADENMTKKWVTAYKEAGVPVLFADVRKRSSLKDLNRFLREESEKKREKDKKRGMKERPVRGMVVGIPNVGKSTFINTLTGRTSTKTGDRPGVTKGKQWIHFNKSISLLDTPGVLWPKFDDQIIGKRLALVGSINPELLHPEELALFLISFLREKYPGILEERYALQEEGTPVEILREIAEKRRILKKGGELSLERAGKVLLDEFRTGKLGRITLEIPGAED